MNARHTRKRPPQQAQPVLCIGLWCFQPFESGKNAQNEMNARHTRKRPPQFADANEEGVYRSMTKQSPAIVHFLLVEIVIVRRTLFVFEVLQEG